MAWLNLGQILHVHAKNYPNKIALKDCRGKVWTYRDLESRTNRLANGLLKMGLRKGDRVAVMLYNCAEFVEIDCAFAKIGLVVVPICWRYVPKEVSYVVDNSDAKAVIAGEDFVGCIEGIRETFTQRHADRYVSVGSKRFEGYIDYESLIAESPNTVPDVQVEGKDTWFQIYTSGTTGIPKGVVRSHQSYIAFYMINAVDFGFSEKDTGMIVMPLYHVNSTFYGPLFLYIGGSLHVGRDKGFDPVELLRTFSEEKITFTSLIPTHYNFILNVPEDVRRRFDVSSVRKLLCSSAPARGEVKKGILKCFPNVELFEAYGSTEAGLVTLLRAEDQLRKLGSIGKECLGTDTLKLLDQDEKEVPVGEVGELYSRGPMMFDEYHKLPDKTKASFRDGYFTARDMARKDEEGYYYLVDRKDNMIITGGEHVYPSEVEAVICQNPKVFDVAVIGVSDNVWGEAVKAVVILKQGEKATPDEIIKWCKDRIAGYKKPKTVDFIEPEEMPRTTTGKILHRKLREKYAQL
ncbi:MAG TPA: AMP-binding protein [Candidatus Bathyarchaeia archaeon]|nr:AMP-binding protein [Candidatus Bathyarchaeia archaeon]